MWFKVDDRWHDHPKVLQVGNEAAGIWARMGSWSANYCTGGVVPHAKALAIAGAMAPLEQLQKVSLLERDGDTWIMHDWSDYNPSADEAREYTEKKRNAGRLGAKRRWGKKGKRDSTCHNKRDSKQHGKAMAQGTGTGTGINKEEEPPSQPAKKTHPKDAEVDAYWAHMLELRKRAGLKRPVTLTTPRRGHLRRRLEDWTLDDLKAAAAAHLDPNGWHVTNRETDPDLVYRKHERVEKMLERGDRAGMHSSTNARAEGDLKSPAHAPIAQRPPETEEARKARLSAIAALPFPKAIGHE